MEIKQYNTMMKSLRREKKLEEALKHIEGMCVFENICITELTRKEALNTITWIRERAEAALRQEV
jgi:pentatricopeptide repeat protein